MSNILTDHEKLTRAEREFLARVVFWHMEDAGEWEFLLGRGVGAVAQEWAEDHKDLSDADYVRSTIRPDLYTEKEAQHD